MKEFILNNIELITSLVAMITTWVLGKLAKKSKLVQDKKIPIQNVVVGITITAIYYLATGDWSMVVASGSPVATLIYDIIHNHNKEE